VQGSVWKLYWSLSICLNLFRLRVSACFVYGKTVANQRKAEKSAFEDRSEENSVWILIWRTWLGIFCKICFTPAVTSCYQVHALNADAHLFAALLCYFRCNWFRNISAVTALNSPHPVHAADSYYTRNSSCITLLFIP